MSYPEGWLHNFVFDNDHPFYCKRCGFNKGFAAHNTERGEQMNSPAFRPLGERYLVLPDAIKGEETVIGEYTVSKEADIHQKASEGTVVARGNDCKECTVGAKVLYGKFAGYEQAFDGVRYVVLSESELLGERITTPFDDLEDPSTTGESDRRQKAVNTLKGVFKVT